MIKEETLRENTQNSVLPFHEILQEEALCLSEIKKNGTGGLGLDQITGALRYLVKDIPTVYVPMIYSGQNKSIFNQLAELDENIALILIPYALTEKHSILIAINKSVKQIHIYDSENINPNLENIGFLKLLEPPYNTYFKSAGKSHYGFQKNDWECGVHVIMTGLDLANGIQYAMPITLDLDDKLRQFWRAYKEQEKINAEQFSYLENNRQQKQALLDGIETIRTKQGHFKNETEEPDDLLKPLADALQIELWGNTKRTNSNRLPNPSEEILQRSLRQFTLHFSKLKNTSHQSNSFILCAYLLEQISSINFEKQNYAVTLNERIEQIVLEAKKIPDDQMRSKLIQGFYADIIWSHEKEELETLVNNIESNEIKELSLKIITNCEIKNTMFPILVGMYKRLTQQHLEDLSNKKIVNTRSNTIDAINEKKLQALTDRTKKIKESLKIDDAFAEFLAKEPYGIYQIIQSTPKNDLINYTRDELDLILEMINKTGTHTVIADIFDKTQFNNLLFTCARCDFDRLLEFLIHKGVDINSKDLNDANNTAMHIAVEKLNQAVVEVLLKNGANLNLQNSDGNTPLHLVMLAGAKSWISNGIVRSIDSLSLLELILKQNPNIMFIQNLEGDTPLHLATMNGCMDSVRLLLQYNTDICSSINLLNNAGYTALDYALRNAIHKHDKNFLLISRLLKKYGGDLISLRTDICVLVFQGVMQAASQGDIMFIQLLLECGIDINLKYDSDPRKHYDTILNLVIHYYGSELNPRGGDKRAQYLFAKFIRELLEKKIDVNLKSAWGKTPLMIIFDIERYSIETKAQVIVYLLQYGADLEELKIRIKALFPPIPPIISELFLEILSLSREDHKLFTKLIDVLLDSNTDNFKSILITILSINSEIPVYKSIKIGIIKHWLCRDVDIKLLQTCIEKQNEQSRKEIIFTFWENIQTSHLSIIKFFITAGYTKKYSLILTPKEKNLCILEASKIGCDEIFNYYYPELPIIKKINILSLAINGQHTSAEKFLLTKGMDKNKLLVQTLSQTDETSKETLKIVNCLLLLGANPNQVAAQYQWKMGLIEATGTNYYLLHKILEITNSELRNGILTLFLKHKVDTKIVSPYKMNLLEHFLSLETTWPKSETEHQEIRETVRLLVNAGIDPNHNPPDKSGLYNIEANNSLSTYAARLLNYTYYQMPLSSFFRLPRGEFSNQKSWVGHGAIVMADYKGIKLDGLGAAIKRPYRGSTITNTSDKIDRSAFRVPRY